MKTWERLVKQHAGVNRFQARVAADEIADRANAIGMYTSDCLELMISAVQSWTEDGTKESWWSDLRTGRIRNQATSVTLDWMPHEFSKHELVWFARTGVRLMKQNPDIWGIAEPPD